MNTGRTVPFDVIVGTADKEIIKAETEEESLVNMTGEAKPTKLKRALYFIRIENSLISVSSLRDDGHIAKSIK